MSSRSASVCRTSSAGVAQTQASDSSCRWQIALRGHATLSTDTWPSCKMHTQHQLHQKFQPTSSDMERGYVNCASLWGFVKHVFHNGSARAASWAELSRTVKTGHSGQTASVCQMLRKQTDFLCHVTKEKLEHGQLQFFHVGRSESYWSEVFLRRQRVISINQMEKNVEHVKRPVLIRQSAYSHAKCQHPALSLEMLTCGCFAALPEPIGTA